MDKITPRLPRGCTGGESIYTLARHHWPPSGGNTPLVVGASDEIDTEPLLSALFVIAVQCTVMCLTQTQKLITVTTSTKEMRTSLPKEPIPFFGPFNEIVFMVLKLLLLIYLCSGWYSLIPWCWCVRGVLHLKFLAVGLIKKINVLVLLDVHDHGNLFIEPLFHFASLYFIKNIIYE